MHQGPERIVCTCQDSHFHSYYSVCVGERETGEERERTDSSIAKCLNLLTSNSSLQAHSRQEPVLPKKQCSQKLLGTQGRDEIIKKKIPSLTAWTGENLRREKSLSSLRSWILVDRWRFIGPECFSVQDWEWGACITRVAWASLYVDESSDPS